jgi:hypothetical protein
MPDDFIESDRQKTHRHSRRGRQLRSVDRSHKRHPFRNDVQKRDSVAVDVQQVRALSGEGQAPGLSRPTLSSPRAARLASAEMAEPRRDCRRRSASQAPFRRTGGVLAYLGRYAVANTRLIRLNDLGMPFN